MAHFMVYDHPFLLMEYLVRLSFQSVPYYMIRVCTCLLTIGSVYRVHLSEKNRDVLR